MHLFLCRYLFEKICRNYLKIDPIQASTDHKLYNKIHNYQWATGTGKIFHQIKAYLVWIAETRQKGIANLSRFAGITSDIQLGIPSWTEGRFMPNPSVPASGEFDL